LFGADRNEELKKLREEMEELKKSMRALTEERITEDSIDVEPRAPETRPQREEEEPSIEGQPSDEAEAIPPREPPSWEEVRSYRRARDWDSWGDSLGDYIGSFVEDVMEGVGAELERSLFADSHVRHSHRERRTEPLDTKGAAGAMSALGNEHRIKILEEMSYGGLYSKDLQEVLPEISASTLSSHLDVLQEAGLITQERRRGRYLITIPGRLAVKMAYQIADRIGRSRRHE
jgi:DNA-binding transcriptional ArsR family regulator